MRAAFSRGELVSERSGRDANGEDGTWVEFTPDPEIFGEYTWNEEFIEHRFTRPPDNGTPRHDEAFFSDLVHGVLKHQVEIDRSIAKELAQGWTLGRIDSTLRALLRAASYELVARRDVPAKVVIDEYVELARDFFDGEEPGFVNAVLDRLAHRKRAAEFGETPPDDELQF